MESGFRKFWTRRKNKKPQDQFKAPPHPQVKPLVNRGPSAGLNGHPVSPQLGRPSESDRPRKSHDVRRDQIPITDGPAAATSRNRTQPILTGISGPDGKFSRPGTSGGTHAAPSRPTDVMPKMSMDETRTQAKTKSPRYIDIFQISSVKPSNAYNEDVAERNLDMVRVALESGAHYRYVQGSTFQEEVAIRNAHPSLKGRHSIDVARPSRDIARPDVVTNPAKQTRPTQSHVKGHSKSSSIGAIPAEGLSAPNPSEEHKAYYWREQRLKAQDYANQLPSSPATQDNRASYIEPFGAPSYKFNRKTGLTTLPGNINSGRDFNTDLSLRPVVSTTSTTSPSSPQSLPGSGLTDYLLSPSEIRSPQERSQRAAARKSFIAQQPKPEDIPVRPEYSTRSPSGISVASTKRSINLPTRTIMDLTGSEPDVSAGLLSSDQLPQIQLPEAGDVSSKRPELSISMPESAIIDDESFAIGQMSSDRKPEIPMRSSKRPSQSSLRPMATPIRETEQPEFPAVPEASENVQDLHKHEVASAEPGAPKDMQTVSKPSITDLHIENAPTSNHETEKGTSSALSSQSEDLRGPPKTQQNIMGVTLGTQDVTESKAPNPVDPTEVTKSVPTVDGVEPLGQQSSDNMDEQPVPATMPIPASQETPWIHEAKEVESQNYENTTNDAEFENKSELERGSEQGTLELSTAANSGAVFGEGAIERNEPQDDGGPTVIQSKSEAETSLAADMSIESEPSFEVPESVGETGNKVEMKPLSGLETVTASTPAASRKESEPATALFGGVGDSAEVPRIQSEPKPLTPIQTPSDTGVDTSKEFSKDVKEHGRSTPVTSSSHQYEPEIISFSPISTLASVAPLEEPVADTRSVSPEAMQHFQQSRWAKVPHLNSVAETEREIDGAPSADKSAAQGNLVGGQSNDTPSRSVASQGTPGAAIQISPESLNSTDFINPSRAFGVITRDFADSPSRAGPSRTRAQDAYESNTGAKVTQPAKSVDQSMMTAPMSMHRLTTTENIPTYVSTFNEEEYARKREQARAALIRLQQSLNEDFMEDLPKQSKASRTNGIRKMPSDESRPIAPSAIFGHGRNFSPDGEVDDGDDASVAETGSIYDQVTRLNIDSSDPTTNPSTMSKGKQRETLKPSPFNEYIRKPTTEERMNELALQVASLNLLPPHQSQNAAYRQTQSHPPSIHHNPSQTSLPRYTGSGSNARPAYHTPSQSQNYTTSSFSPPSHGRTMSSDMYRPLVRRGSTRSQASSSSAFSIPYHMIPDRSSSMRDQLVRETEEETIAY